MAPGSHAGCGEGGEPALKWYSVDPGSVHVGLCEWQDDRAVSARELTPDGYMSLLEGLVGGVDQAGLLVVEDAAQGVMSSYKGKALGTIGDFGCYSFHETKNYSMGEGGAILFQDDRYLEPAEILREKGTNRSQYFRGQIDKYTWVGYGSSYLPSDMNAAYLWAQLEVADKINDKRLSIWNFYHEELKELEDKGVLERPYIPEYATHNAHMYYIKVKDLRVRTKLLAYLKERGILSVFHYVINIIYIYYSSKVTFTFSNDPK